MGLGTVANTRFAAEGASELPWAACFLPGTMIHTKQGAKPIEQIALGDWVAARNQTSQQTQWRPVLQVFTSKDKDVVHVRVEHHDGNFEIISATTEHPFYVSGKGWCGANALQPGDSLELLEGGQSKVVAVVADGGKHTVHNFEVADDHTYFVGERGIWVHNTSSVRDALLEMRGGADCKLLPSGIGGTGARYNKETGQGLYVLYDEAGAVRYVGRGDAPARLVTHADSIDKSDLVGEVLWTNNLSKAQAKGIEQRLIDHFGGAARQSPDTPLLNEYRSYAPENPNASVYASSATDELWFETLKRLGL
jgi:hypothetical protein